MNYDIRLSSYVVKELKNLSKHYPSFKSDYVRFLESIRQNPWQGVDLGNGLRKIRMPISAKGKGKAGGARMITLNMLIDEENMYILFLLLYDKQQADNFNKIALKEALKEFGL